MFVLLNKTQEGPGRTVKQEQEEISRNHVQTFICLSVSVQREVKKMLRPPKDDEEEDKDDDAMGQTADKRASV